MSAALQLHFPKLSPRQRRFVEHVVSTGRKAEAVEAAGYKSRNLSRRASELMRHPAIAAAIEARMREELELVGIEAHRVLKELAHIGFADPAALFAKQEHVDRNEAKAVGELLALRFMPEAVRRAVASVKITDNTLADGTFIGYTTEVKFWNKLDALEKIGKYLKLWMEAGGQTNIFAAPGSNVQINGVLVLPAVRD